MTETKSAKSGRVLVVDDSIENLNMLTTILEKQGIQVVGAPTGELALSLAERLPIDLALLDILMPGLDGFRLCELLPERGKRRFPVIFISGRTDQESIERAFQVGGVDYVTKPIQEKEVVARVSTHLRLAQLQRELEDQNEALRRANDELAGQIRLRQQAEQALRDAEERISASDRAEAAEIEGFVGTSEVTRGICEEVRRLHEFSRTNVLVHGESGTGKELIARAIHYGSPHRARPFVAINCSAVPPELAESTFFGHVRGAFTGATSDRKGCFEQAHQGTLFLDEIGELSWPLQAKLLRTLEGGGFTPVGASHERRADVRVICATHADLQAKIEAGSFRQDLYFRLAQYVVQVPPLRERRQDIPLLVLYFLTRSCEQLGRKVPEVTPEALLLLQQHAFPGNVRELKNIAERTLILSAGNRIDAQHIELAIGRPTPAGAATGAAPLGADTLRLDEVQKELVTRALERAQGNVSAAAKLLGVHRSFFYRRKLL